MPSFETFAAEPPKTGQENLPEAIKNEKIDRTDEEIARHSKLVVEHLAFRWGEVDETDISHKFVSEIRDRVADKDKYPLRILAGWKDRGNAFAFPDGTIILTPQIILEAESVEEIAGIQAHEMVHIEKGHSKKSIDREKPKDIDTLLKYIGFIRGTEYEADLRAAIEKLEGAGINPMGLKEFLDRMAEKETRTDLAHGHSMDRALNLASATHFIDLKALEEDFHPIPEEVKEALRNARAKPNFDKLFFRPYSGLKDRTKKARQESKDWKEREELLDSVPPNHAIFAVESIKQSTRGKIDLRDRKIFNKAVDKYVESFVPPDTNLSKKDRERLGLFTLDLFTGVVIVSKERKTPQIEGETEEAGVIQKKQRERFSELMKDRKNWAELKKAIEDNFEKIAVVPGALDAEVSIKDLVQRIIVSNMFGNLEDENFEAESFIDFLKEWSDVFEKLAERFGSKFVSSEQIFNNLIKLILPLKMSSKTFDHIVKFSPEKVETIKEAEEISEEERQIKEVGTLIGNAKSQAQAEKLVDSLSKEYAYIFKNKNVWETAVLVVGLISSIDNVTTERISRDKDFQKRRMASAEMDDEEEDKRYPMTKEARDAEQADKILSEILSYTFFEKVFSQSDQYGKMSDREKNFVRLFASSFFYLQGTIEKIDITEIQLDDEDYEMDPAERERIRGYLRTIEEAGQTDFILDPDRPKDEKDLRLAYLYLVDPKEKGPSQEMHELDFARYFNQFIEKKSFLDIISFLDKLKKEDIDAERVIVHETRENETLIEKMAEAVEDKSFFTLPLQRQFEISFWIDNPKLQQIIRGKILEEAYPNMTFEERLALVFSKESAHQTTYSVKDRFIENEIETRDQVEKCKDTLRKSFDQFLSGETRLLGAAAIFFLGGTKSVDSNEFMEALLTSQSSENELNEFIRNHVIFDREHDEESLRDEKETEIEKSNRYRVESIKRSLYLLEDSEKQLLLRKLLTDKTGVLRTSEKRERFLNFLFYKWLKSTGEEEDVLNVIYQVKEGLQNATDWQLLYFAFQGLLRDKIAIPPREKSGTEEAREIESFMEEEEIDPEEKEEIRHEIEIRAILKSLSPLAKAEKRLSVAIGAEQQEKGEEIEGLRPVQFVKEFGSRLGAPGVRFLQLLPQIVELPEEYEREFSEIYDQVKGQSKMTAITTIEREWPDVWTHIRKIGKRIGGGSIMTVYEMETVDGEEEVIKVRNPNVRYHLQEVTNFARLVLQELAKKYGSGYKAALDSLDDIKQWIENDTSFTDFISKDKAFREKNSGFTAEGHGYRIIVPESVGPENQYFTREKKISGTNLTQWEKLQEQGHDLKQITSLLVKNYVGQIFDGQVHSDVHVGNFGVTPENEIAIYDRNYYLELTEEERDLIFSFFSGDKKVRDQLMSYLNIERNADKEKITELVDSLAENIATQNTQAAQVAIARMKQEGVKMPIKITLILKNINSLKGMTRKAGFTSLFEAFSYQP